MRLFLACEWIIKVIAFFIMQLKVAGIGKILINIDEPDPALSVGLGTNKIIYIKWNSNGVVEEKSKNKLQSTRALRWTPLGLIGNISVLVS